MALDTDHFILMFLALRASKSLFVVQTIVLGQKERNRVEAGFAGKLDPSKQFDFSEIYIFRKYENIFKRSSCRTEILTPVLSSHRR